ncbi:hypothetical protein [Roseomonas chloroacetimidivorans]|uniref:hypothetical protein n=1 Tax=Roseomonas chloroacetimidivorans TaxID=1766656 RepID=UPI003C794780
MPFDKLTRRALREADIEHFMQNGFVRIDDAFPGDSPTGRARCCGATPAATRMICLPGRSQ